MRKTGKSNSALRWAAACAAGCVWIGLWAAVSAPGTRSTAARLRQPRANLFFVGGDVTGRLAAAELWSPAVFSLPSPAGFSSFAREAHRYVRLPLAEGFDTPLLFEIPPEDGPRLAIPPLSVAATAMPELAIWRTPSRDLSREGSGSTQGGKRYRPVVTALEGVDPACALKIDVPREGAPPRNGRMVLYVRTDPEGIVLHVIPEEFDPDYEDLHRILLSAYAWRFAAEESPVEARVVIDWLPEPGGSGAG